jgi:endogenous inhibitor of DNA gyrase (YacG/DUF329 family)
MKRVKCPNCGKITNWENNPYRPFCSEKCKLADLSRWLNEEYTISVEESSLEEDHENNPSP